MGTMIGTAWTRAAVAVAAIMKQRAWSKRLACVSALAVAVASVSVTTASAGTYTRVTVSANGVWKGLAGYKTTGNEFCVRAYNSTSGAKAIAGMEIPSQRDIIWIEDKGGDDRPTCTTIAFWLTGHAMNISLHHYNDRGIRTPCDDCWVEGTV